jgi:hypothetical protein
MKAWLCVLAGFAVACGGSEGMVPQNDSGANPDSGVSADTGVMPMPDASDDTMMMSGEYGAPSMTYPAFTPWMGQLANNGGSTIANPVVVTITWDADTSRSFFEGFGDGLGMSNYWAPAVGEYGIGMVSSGMANHSHVTTAPPASMSDQQIRAFLAAGFGTTFPTPTNQMIYVVYLPKTTTLLFQNQNACQVGVGGYHNSFAYNNGQVAYAVLPRCGGDDTVTAASSHEIGEAVTDPHPGQPAWVGFEDQYLAFDLWQRNNSENGDACEFFQDSYYKESQPFGYEVQRLWSNKQGPLGHSPCQPYSAPYFNMAPLNLQDITVNLGQGTIKAKGYIAKQGDTIKIPLGFYSDQSTPGAWTVAAAESNPLVNPVTGRLMLSIDPMKTIGVNGEKTYLNVTVTMEGPQKVELLTVISTLSAVKHYLPLLISSQ